MDWSEDQRETRIGGIAREAVLQKAARFVEAAIFYEHGDEALARRLVRGIERKGRRQPRLRLADPALVEQGRRASEFRFGLFSTGARHLAFFKARQGFGGRFP